MKRNEVNLLCTVRRPVKLPTWGHIAQMRLNVRRAKKEWGFFKEGREAAYRQLPMSPENAALATIALRHPSTHRRMAFRPDALLFSASSDVVRYNCFSLLPDVIFNKNMRRPSYRLL